MFTDTWKKYLPVIAILLKRSAKGEQMLSLDESDFKRAAGGRKIKFSFNSLKLSNGRTEINAGLSPMAKGFAQSMTNSDMIKLLTRNQEFEFEMNSDFQLIIKNNTQPVSMVQDSL
jgi:hypothetical protein